MIDMPVLQFSSCTRCKTSILGNPSPHLDTCNQLERFDQASAQLYRMGYESLSLDQIGLLVEMLLTTDLSGYDIADVVSDHEEKDISTVLCLSCNNMIDAYSEHNCRG